MCAETKGPPAPSLAAMSLTLGILVYFVFVIATSEPEPGLSAGSDTAHTLGNAVGGMLFPGIISFFIHWKSNYSFLKKVWIFLGMLAGVQVLLLV